MHPELQSLVQRYEALVDAVDAGSMSLDQAMHTLSAMSVMDGAGGQWSLTADGQFQRAQPPGPPVPADPSAFVAPTLSPPPSAMPGWDPAPSFPPPGVSSDYGAPVPAPQMGEVPMSLMGQPAEKTGGRNLLQGFDVQSLLRHRTAIIVVAAVLIGGFLVLRSMSSGDGAPQEVVPSASPSPSQDMPVDDPGDQPSDDQQATAPSEDTENSPGDTQSKGEKVAQLLVDGSAADLAKVSTSQQYDAVLLLAAQVRGAESAGLKVRIAHEPASVSVGFARDGKRIALVTLTVDKQGKVTRLGR